MLPAAPARRSRPRRWLGFPVEEALRAAGLHAGRNPWRVNAPVAQGHPVHIAEPSVFLRLLNRTDDKTRLGVGANIFFWSESEGKATVRDPILSANLFLPHKTSKVDHIG